jgi:hypothetical protein
LIFNINKKKEKKRKEKKRKEKKIKGKKVPSPSQRYGLPDSKKSKILPAGCVFLLKSFPNKPII